MNYNEILSLIVEENHDMIFISDRETYELYYLNQAALNILDLEEEREWKGKKCYEVLQGLTSPCMFCKNSCVWGRLSKGKPSGGPPFYYQAVV